MRPTRRIVSTLLVGTLGATLSVALASSAADADVACPSVVDGQVTTDEVPAGTDVIACALVGVDVLRVGGSFDMIVDMPPAGELVTLVADGKTLLSGATFTIAVSDSGEVSYPDEPSVASGSSSTGLSPAALMEELSLLLADNSGPQTDPCTDTASKLFGGKWKESPTWYINQAGRPSNISADDAVAQIRMGKNNVSGANNDCDLPDNVNRDATYGGLSSVAVDIISNPSNGNVRCTQSGDSISVVGFGATPSDILGYACVRYSTSDTDAFRGGDILVTNNANTLVLDGNALGCLNRYDMQGLMTHEWGHFFGLKHVGETNHGTLTMSPNLGSCTRAERTLGLGDLIGLESLY